jgi:5'-3' exonuclease
MLQAISLGADVFLTPKNIIVNKLNFKEVTGGVNPEDWVFYRSITGDQGDGIPGLKGFGPVTQPSQDIKSKYIKIIKNFK